jgi:hypothetical protein
MIPPDSLEKNFKPFELPSKGDLEESEDFEGLTGLAGLLSLKKHP